MTPSFTGWGQSRPGGARTCAGSCSGQLPHPRRSARTAPAGLWGDPGGCRCLFPVEGLRARVARGGKERRPFRRVTAAESPWLTHPGRPSLPGPERPGPPATSRERGRCRQRSLDPGTGVTGPLGPQSWARDTAVWTCLGLRLLFPEDWAPTPRAQPRSLNPVFPNTEPHLNPFLTFLAVREEWQVIPGAHAVQRGILLGSFTSFTAFHRI